MVRSSIAVRLAGLGAALLLVGGMLAQAAPALAAAPAHPQASSWSSQASAVKQLATRTINVRSLAAHPSAKLPFNPAAVSAALRVAEAAKPRSAKAGATSPDVVGPPDPDLATDSGAPAAATPVASAGQTQAGSTEPADPGIAVAPDEVIQVDNASVEVSDRAGNSLVTDTLSDLFGLTARGSYTTFDAEPRVLFDTVRQRWIITELSWDCSTYEFDGVTPSFGHGFIDYAISDTADPLGSWTGSSFGWNDALPDLPGLGTSTDKFALTSRLFAMGSGGSDTTPGCISSTPAGAAAIVVDWTDLGPGFDALKLHFAYGPYSNLEALQVATQEPITDPDLRMIGRADGSGAGETADDVIYVDVTGSAVKKTIGEAAYKDLTADAIIPAFADPPSVHQSGGTLTSVIDGSPDSVIAGRGLLAFAATYPCTPGGDSTTRDCVRVTTLANATPSAEPTRLADTLLASNGLDSSFGGIAWSGNGVLHAVYTQSGASAFASSFDQYQAFAAKATPAWSAPAELSPGTAVYSGTRWGAYNQVATDPADPSAVWTGDAFSSGGWATTIHELSVGAGAGYVALSPVRVLDTRAGTGLSGAMVANVPRSFVVANFNPKHLVSPIIPANAVAITANLTVTGATAGGYVALGEFPTASPTTEAIAFPTNDNRANNVTVGLGPDGKLSAVYKAASGKHVDLILDVTGYFVAGSGQRYSPIAPVRILDSRTGLGTTKFHANVARSFLVAGFKDKTNTVLIPSNAIAITANLTVTDQTKAGHVTVTPTPNNHPTTSTINFPLKDNRANGLTIPIDPLTGKVSAVFTASSGTTDLTMDVTGYYSSDVSGLLFHPLDPGRRVDSRLALGTSGFGNGLSGAQGATPRPAVIAGHTGVPGAAAAISGDLTITGQTALGHVTITPVSNAAPTTSTLNFPLGDTRSNGVTVPLGSGEVWFVYQGASGKHVQVILDITGYFE